MADSYRRMRNTVRFLLGNLHGFDPRAARGARPRWWRSTAGLLSRTRALQDEIVAAYRNYEFHLIYQKVHNFCVVDLGGFYLDVIKDRLYTTPTESGARRSAQTAMYPHRREHGALARADPVLHGGGDLAVPAGRAGGVGVPGNLAPAAGSRIGWHRLERADRAAHRRAARAGRSCASRARSARRSKRRSTCTCRAGSSRSSMRWARSCGSCSSRPRHACTRSMPRRSQKAGDARVNGVAIYVHPTEAAKCARCWHRRPDVGPACGPPRAVRPLCH